MIRTQQINPRGHSRDDNSEEGRVIVGSRDTPLDLKTDAKRNLLGMINETKINF